MVIFDDWQNAPLHSTKTFWLQVFSYRCTSERCFNYFYCVRKAAHPKLHSNYLYLDLRVVVYPFIHSWIWYRKNGRQRANDSSFCSEIYLSYFLRFTIRLELNVEQSTTLQESTFSGSRCRTRRDRQLLLVWYQLFCYQQNQLRFNLRKV